MVKSGRAAKTEARQVQRVTSEALEVGGLLLLLLLLGGSGRPKRRRGKRSGPSKLSRHFANDFKSNKKNSNTSANFNRYKIR